MFDKCASVRKDFEVGKTLLGIVTDWSDAEINGLKSIIGPEKAELLLKGCQVHWQRSCQRVADRVATSSDKQKEKKIFLAISNKIQKVESDITIVACYEALCGVRPIKDLLKKLPGVCSIEDANFVDEKCDWSIAKHWAEWWTRASQNAVSSLFTNG